MLYKKYKKLNFKIADLIVVLLSILCFAFITAIVTDFVARKSDVIVNNNYKTNKILVKHYYMFNIDSVYYAYDKPKTYKLKVKEIIGSKRAIVVTDNNEIWKIKTMAKYLKQGETITVHRKFYPNDYSETSYGIKFIWLDKLN